VSGSLTFSGDAFKPPGDRGRNQLGLADILVSDRSGSGECKTGMMKRRSPIMTKLLRPLGPGLLTGAADDDPSGIATYSQSGAQLGYALCWLMFLTTPFMVAIQIASARIGSATGRGLAANLRQIMPPFLLYGLLVVFALANVFNIAADIAAMGQAARLLAGGPAAAYALCLGMICLLAQIFIPYRLYAQCLKLLTLVLFAYVAAAFGVDIAWREVAASTLLPHLSLDRDYILMLVAVLGTTISPYLFFWQASLEVEERRLVERRKEAPLRNGKDSAGRRFERIVGDTWTGMVLSNVIGFFIMVTTAATLHARGVHSIATAAQAAEVLRPFAGPFAFFLFTLGIVGTGLLAIPALAGSAAYALAETFGWKNSLGLRLARARGFYFLLAGATAIGALGAISPLNPITMLVCSAVFNGIVAVPLMAGLMIVVTNRKVMGKFAASRMLTVFGWLATLFMGVAVAAFFVTTLTG
jgi:NRAMP (natural resistance-associated macrophage protein)-like metal ion transporter